MRIGELERLQVLFAYRLDEVDAEPVAEMLGCSWRELPDLYIAAIARGKALVEAYVAERSKKGVG